MKNAPVLAFEFERPTPLPGHKMHFTETTVLWIENGGVAEEIGLDDGVPALTQLSPIRAAEQTGQPLHGRLPAYAAARDPSCSNSLKL